MNENMVMNCSSTDLETVNKKQRCIHSRNPDQKKLCVYIYICMIYIYIV